MYANDNVMYDLHGLSESEAENLVTRVLREASGNKRNKLRFITGRGNHVNSKGNKGTLFSEFPTWLKSSQFSDRIAHVDQQDGHYTVTLNQVRIDPRPEKMFEKFQDAFLKNNLHHFKMAADKGDGEMMVLYAQLLEDGQHLAQNIPLAVDYMRKAANANYPPGMHEYARYWLHGIGVKQSDQQAKQWLWKAHRAGCIPSTVTLGKSYANALPGYEYDIQKAIELHTIGANAGATDSMRFFGSIYIDGSGVLEPSPEMSFKWYKKAADAADAKAQFNVAVYYHDGNGVEKNEQQSQHYFKLAAQGGDADAQFQHAMSFYNTPGKENREKAVMWLFTAADNGSEQANTMINKVLKNTDSREFLERSAKAGNLNSRIMLDKLNGIDRTVDQIPISEITSIFKMLGVNEIKLMSVDAKFLLLDRILLEGNRKYKLKAFDCLIDLERGNCEFAIRRLAYFHARGDGILGIKKSPARVNELRQKGAELGDPMAMVIHSQHESILNTKKLLRAAAEKKYPPAFYQLGLLYEAGHFGDQKMQEALTCYQSAVKHEQTPLNLSRFIMGPMDEYQHVLELAQAKIALIKPTIKPKCMPAKSTLKAGFFNTESTILKSQAADSPHSNNNIDDRPADNIGSQSPMDVNDDLSPLIIEAQDEQADDGYLGSFFSYKNRVLSAAGEFVSSFFSPSSGPNF